MGPFVAVALLVLVGRTGLAGTPEPVTPGPPTTSDAPPSPTPLIQVTTLPRTGPGTSPPPTLASHLVKARPSLRMTTRTIPARQDVVDAPKTVMSLIGAITTSVDPKEQPLALSTMSSAKTTADQNQSTANNNSQSTAKILTSAKLPVTTNNYSQTRTTASYFSQSTARILTTSSDYSQGTAKLPETEKVQIQNIDKIKTAANNYSQTMARVITTTQNPNRTKAKIADTTNDYNQTSAKVLSTTPNPNQSKAKTTDTFNNYNRTTANILSTYSSSTTFKTETTAKLPVTASDSSPTTTAKTTMAKLQPTSEGDVLTTAKIDSTESSTEQESELVHPRFPSDLEQRLESLHCSLPPLPPKSRLWRGNQTHELNLPISTDSGGLLGWSVNAQLQSGDVLVVRIDTRSLLEPSNDTTSKFGAAVFSVPRGEALRRCDASQGILLDISPVMLDGRLILALYDKDLSDGENYLAVISQGFEGLCAELQVTIKTDNCGDEQACSGHGLCYSLDTMEGYECHCCRGFMGNHCEERDLCQPSPCLNNGICVDVGQDGEAVFHCLCPYGYTGVRCEQTTDPCSSSPCIHGGTCSHNGTAFTCACPDGLTGMQCEHRLPVPPPETLTANACGDVGCIHGVCVRQGDPGGMHSECFCKPGYGGPACEFEYDECLSNPCENGGECEDLVDSFRCRCRSGYEGATCNIKVDPCGSSPCSAREICKAVAAHFECHPGSDFEAPCHTNRCLHGGTCINAQSTFFCICPSGYTGHICNNTAVMWGELESSVPEVAAAPPPRLLVPHLLVPLHSMYFAMAILSFSVLIVAVTLGVYYCRVNQTYKKWMTTPCGSDVIESQRLHIARPRGNGVGGGSGVGGCVSGSGAGANNCSAGGSPLRHSRSLHDIYYAVDLSDSQTSPLIT